MRIYSHVLANTIMNHFESYHTRNESTIDYNILIYEYRYIDAITGILYLYETPLFLVFDRILVLHYINMQYITLTKDYS